MGSLPPGNEYENIVKSTGYTVDEFDKLMYLLNELNLLMKEKKDGGGGIGYEAERYCGICRASDRGKDCPYAQKSGVLFIKNGQLVKFEDWLKRMIEFHGRNQNTGGGSGQTS